MDSCDFDPKDPIISMHVCARMALVGASISVV